MKIKGAVLRETGKPYRIEELELDAPKEKEALVRYVYSGFCHSDLSVLHGRIPAELPMAGGHECAGIVEEVGPGCTKVKKGDHVVGTWVAPCGECKMCRRGVSFLCTGNSKVVHTRSAARRHLENQRHGRQDGATRFYRVGFFQLLSRPGSGSYPHTQGFPP